MVPVFWVTVGKKTENLVQKCGVLESLPHKLLSPCFSLEKPLDMAASGTHCRPHFRQWRLQGLKCPKQKRELTGRMCSGSLAAFGVLPCHGGGGSPSPIPEHFVTLCDWLEWHLKHPQGCA